MKQNIVFFGSGSYTIPVVKKLIKHGLSLVVTTEKSGKLIDFCKENGIKLLTVSNQSPLTSHFSLLTSHSLGVLASFGAIVPDKIITSFKYGIINIHPSLLPRWKGPSPIQYTLLNNDTQTGVTLIKLDNEVDHGPILSQTVYKLNGDETTKELLGKLFSIGADMVEAIVVKLEQGRTLQETPQDHSKESWSYKITKEDGHIDTNKLNSKPYSLNAMIRAFYPWPSVWLRANLNAKTKIVKLLPNEKIQVEGKNPMNYKDFINGYGEEGKELLAKLNLIND